jgi:hypothetical protein
MRQNWTDESVISTAGETWCILLQTTVLPERGADTQAKPSGLCGSWRMLSSRSTFLGARNHCHLQGPSRWPSVTHHGIWGCHRLHGTRRWDISDSNFHVTIVQLEYLDATVLWRGLGEIRVVVGRDPACWQGWRDVSSHWKQTNDLSQHPSTFTNGLGEPLRSFFWTVSSKYYNYKNEKCV